MITLRALELENFTSWHHCTLPLDAQGRVCMHGPTGAGKSSLWHALHYCFFGACPDPVRADEIRQPGKAATMRLTAEKEGHDYTITRYRKHPQYGNKVFFTGHGIPDVVEDSHIKTVQGLITQFLGINNALFRTTVYLAQRNFHQFHTMTEHAQKVFLESVTFGSLFERCETATRERVRQQERDLERLKGRLQGLDVSLHALTEQTIARKREMRQRLRNIDVAVRTCEETIALIEKAREPLLPAIDAKYEVEVKLATSERQHREAQDDVERYSQINQLCPRCGLVMLECLRRERLEKAKKLETKFADRLCVLIATYEGLREKCQRLSEYEAQIEQERDGIRAFQRERALLQSTFRQHSHTRELMEQRTQLRKDILILRRQLAYQTFWVKGFGLQGLRGMVLAKALHYFTDHVRSYLYRILHNRVDFVCTLEQNRLLTECNGRSYWSLSGGERQSVDLCTGLALRDLAETYNKCRFNVAIYDEPFEGFDAELTAAGQELLMTCGKSSTFLVTHRDVTVPFDIMYSVTKDKAGSHLRRVY